MGRVGLIVLGMSTALAISAVLNILTRRRRDPPAMVAWILAILLLPGIGLLAYWLFGSNRLWRKARRRRRRMHKTVAALRTQAQQRTHRHEQHDEDKLPDDLAAIARLGERLTDFPPVGGNDVLVLREANATYAALEAAMRGARDHIHMLYYIWQPDETGFAFRDLVVERARAGIKCRLLLDAVGCLRIGRIFLRPLLDAGVQVAFYLPLLSVPLRRRWSLHLRNHRKIVVVDGHMAFMGSQNIGDEYRGRLRKLSPWYDTHLRLAGPAAVLLQEVFAEDWYEATRERIEAHYFPEPPRPGQSIVQILPTGPDQASMPLAQLFFAAVSSAERSIRIATPYFVPDPPTLMALAHASYRGVEVRLVIPSRSDVMMALWAGRSFYPELVDAGVEIYEYDAGVLHSKIVAVDDSWCTVGSANMDARSFRLNFEVTAIVYDSRVTSELAQSIDSFCRGGRRITARAAWHREPLRSFGEGVARLFAPLL